MLCCTDVLDKHWVIKLFLGFTNLTFVPSISITRDWMSLSVILFMCPLRTYSRRVFHLERIIFYRTLYLLFPDLKWLATYAVQDRQEARLEGILEHSLPDSEKVAERFKPRSFT